jgi:hypothetical protein
MPSRKLCKVIKDQKTESDANPAQKGDQTAKNLKEYCGAGFSDSSIARPLLEINIL